MKSRKTKISFGFIALLLTFLFSFLECQEKSVPEIGMIFTMVTDFTANPAAADENLNANFSQAKIAMVKLADPGTTPEILTGDFYSACSPQISFDGKKMLFAGQVQKSDSWQIWEMTIHNLKYKKVTSGKEDCSHPAYLPNDKIVYSRRISEDSLKAKHALFTSNLDGNEETRITFHPHSDYHSKVMQDGRILFVSEQVYPSSGNGKLLAMRPDGTKAELFYKGEAENKVFSRAWETDSGNIVFLENAISSTAKRNLVSVSFNNPLSSKTLLNSEITGEFHSVFPLSPGRFLAAYREAGSEKFGLYEFKPTDKKIGSLLHRNDDFHVLEPVLVKALKRPKILPSIVNENKKQGRLLCMNVNNSDLEPKVDLALGNKAVKTQIEGIDGNLGEVKVGEDGSFYIEVPANKPFRFQTIDDQGQAILGPSSWVWVRPNEKRSCIGCHENREMAPENIVPLALEKGPVKIIQ